MGTPGFALDGVDGGPSDAVRAFDVVDDGRRSYERLALASVRHGGVTASRASVCRSARSLRFVRGKKLERAGEESL